MLIVPKIYGFQEPVGVFMLNQIVLLTYVLTWVGLGWVALIVKVSKYLWVRPTTQRKFKLGMMLHQHLGLDLHKARRMLKEIRSYVFQVVLKIDTHKLDPRLYVGFNTM